MPKEQQKNYNASIRILSFESINLLAKTLQRRSPAPSLDQFSLIRFYPESYFIKNTDTPHLPEKIENALAEKKTKETAKKIHEQEEYDTIPIEIIKIKKVTPT